MTKLNKANNDGTVSITIPKSVAKEMGWEPGQEINLNVLDDCHVMISNYSKIEIRDGGIPDRKRVGITAVGKLKDISNSICESMATIYNTCKAFDKTNHSNIMFDEKSYNELAVNTIKRMLGDYLDRL